MTDVLESTAGYIDSELSDYEDNYKDYNNTNNLNNYYLANYNDYTNNNDIYHLKNNNNKNNYKFNHTNSNIESLNNNTLYKWKKCVNKYELKSPRFGRDDLNSDLNKMDSNQNEKEYLYNRTSLDTVDTLTPLSNTFEKSFKWWRDDESHSNISELLNDTTEEEFDNREDFSNVMDNSDNDLTVKNTNELLIEPNKDLVNTTTTNNNTDGIEWKSWTLGTNELNELKTKLLNKLLKNNSNDKFNDDLINNEELPEDQEDGKYNELKYYKEMNKLLLNKLLWLLNNNNYKLEYNLNQQYITSIQNHLVKVHEYINSLTNTNFVNLELDETNSDRDFVNNTNKFSPANSVNNSKEKDTLDETNKSEDRNKSDQFKDNNSGVDFEEYEKLKSENFELKKQVQQLQEKLVNSRTDTTNFSNSSSIDDDGNTNSNDTVEDPEKKELLEKLKLVEESKNMLEEDFKKTLVYMRLMKDRLKFFKDYNSQSIPSSIINNTTPNTINQSTTSTDFINRLSNLSANQYVNQPINQVVNRVLNQQHKNTVDLQTKHVNNTTKFVNSQFKPNQYTSLYNRSPLNRKIDTTGFGVVTTTPGVPSPTVSSFKPVMTNSRNSTTNINNSNNVNNENTLNETVVSNTTVNTNKFSPVISVNNFKKRSNSCVRFKEESELYVVPRSLSETRPTLTNSKFSKFFKLFSKS